MRILAWRSCWRTALTHGSHKVAHLCVFARLHPRNEDVAMEVVVEDGSVTGLSLESLSGQRRMLQSTSSPVAPVDG
eukprot:440892-Pelagomonas_calceolata.AAC.1